MRQDAESGIDAIIKQAERDIAKCDAALATAQQQVRDLRAALVSTSRGDVIAPCWCVVSRDIPNHGHSERCKKATAALAATAEPEAGTL